VPAGSTVVQAYLYGTYFNSTADLDVEQRTLDFDGSTVVLDTLANSEPGRAGLITARADVKTQVAAKVGSGGGITNFALNTDPFALDGIGLVVIYSNPAQHRYAWLCGRALPRQRFQLSGRDRPARLWRRPVLHR
jgi:hypothetical protein